MDEPTPARRRGFILRGQLNVANGSEGVVLSQQTRTDYYHVRLLTWFLDPGINTPSQDRVTIRANLAGVGHGPVNLVIPYIGRRHRIPLELILEPNVLLEVLYLNLSGVSESPEVILTGYLSRSRYDIDGGV